MKTNTDTLSPETETPRQFAVKIDNGKAYNAKNHSIEKAFSNLSILRLFDFKFNTRQWESILDSPGDINRYPDGFYNRAATATIKEKYPECDLLIYTALLAYSVWFFDPTCHRQMDHLPKAIFQAFQDLHTADPGIQIQAALTFLQQLRIPHFSEDKTPLRNELSRLRSELRKQTKKDLNVFEYLLSQHIRETMSSIDGLLCDLYDSHNVIQRHCPNACKADKDNQPDPDSDNLPAS